MVGRVQVDVDVEVLFPGSLHGLAQGDHVGLRVADPELVFGETLAIWKARVGQQLASLF